VLAVAQINGEAAQAGDVIVLPSGATLRLLANGDFDYDPGEAFQALGRGETGTDMFGYRVEDGFGGGDEATATFAIAGAYDTPVGTGRADKLVAGGGRDSIDGGRRGDEISGGRGADTLKGGGGRDTLMGDGGGDRLFGDGGRDVVHGGGGKDRIWGGGGDDTLSGGNGNDELYGGGGRDVLIGDKGRDELTGGKGRDLFVFSVKGVKDVVADFTRSDKIGFAVRRLDFDDLEISENQGDTLIKYKGGLVRLQDTDASRLKEKQFVFENTVDDFI